MLIVGLLLGMILVTLGIVMFQLEQIIKGVNQVMSRQEDFDAQIGTMNTSIQQLSSSIAGVGEAITAEAQQISDFINGLPPELDTSALTGVVERLQTAATDASTLSTSVGDIFTPPTAPEASQPTPPLPE